MKHNQGKTMKPKGPFLQRPVVTTGISGSMRLGAQKISGARPSLGALLHVIWARDNRNRGCGKSRRYNKRSEPLL